MIKNMKRLCLSLIAVLLLISCGNNESSVPERQGWNEAFPLIGDVDSLLVDRYELRLKDGETVEVLLNSNLYKFNVNGDVVEKSEYYEGMLNGKYIYDYSPSGEMTGWTFNGSFGNSNLKCSYKYNDEGYMAEELTSLTRTVYSYDSNGNMIESAQYFAKDSILLSKELYKYDSSDNRVEMSNYDAQGALNYSEIYKYDSHGKLIETSATFVNDVYRFDALEQRSKNESAGTASKELYKYDSKGNLIERTNYDSAGVIRSGNIYKYDDLGNIVENIWCQSAEMTPKRKIVYKVFYSEK